MTSNLTFKDVDDAIFQLVGFQSLLLENETCIKH